jgi:hypothetical protein
MAEVREMSRNRSKTMRFGAKDFQRSQLSTARDFRPRQLNADFNVNTFMLLNNLPSRRTKLRILALAGAGKGTAAIASSIYDNRHA